MHRSPTPNSDRITRRRPDDTCTQSGLHLRRAILGLGNPILNSKHACQLPQKEVFSLYLPRLYATLLLLWTAPPFSKGIHHIKPLKRSTKAVEATARKTCTNVRVPWRTVSQQLMPKQTNEIFNHYDLFFLHNLAVNSLSYLFLGPH